MSNEKHSGPLAIPTDPDGVMSALPRRRIKAVAIKRLRKGSAGLRSSHVLLVMFDDGMVAAFDNTDGPIRTTGGLNPDGWHSALNYLRDIMRVVHIATLKKSDAPDSKLEVIARTVKPS